MNNNWEFFSTVVLLGGFLLVASSLKYLLDKIELKAIIPTSIIAGFIGLICSQDLLNLFALDKDLLGKMVYHLMAIGFIAMSLKKRERRSSKTMAKSGMYIVSGYLIQGLVGLSLVLILTYTFFPDLFVGLGLLLPLGYGQGPGQAFSIGSQWEALGFTHGGAIGLSIATFGFIWATVIGIIWMNYLIRKVNKDKHVIINKPTRLAKVDYELSESDGVDTLTAQIILIGFTYLLTYLTLLGATSLLSDLGTFGQTLSQLLWGFHFNVGAAYGLLIRFIIDRLHEKKILEHDITSSIVLQRISGTAFDFMITASITAISISALVAYFIPVMLLTTAGGLITIFYTVNILNRSLTQNKMENIIAFYGMQTGTISTGMALLKGIDPNYETDAAENLVFGSAFAMVLGIPLMVLINLPIMGYVNNQPIYYLITLALFAMYLLVLLFFQFRKTKSSIAEIEEKRIG